MLARGTGGAIGGRMHGLVLARKQRVESALRPLRPQPPRAPSPTVLTQGHLISTLHSIRLGSDAVFFFRLMSGRAVRYVAAAAAKSGTGMLQLLCHVKPGVSASREGIAAVSEDRIDVCVAAQARDGEANKAVRRVVADALGVAKSDVEVVKGTKSRDKTVAVRTARQETPEEQVDRIKGLLQRSAGT